MTLDDPGGQFARIVLGLLEARNEICSIANIHCHAIRPFVLGTWVEESLVFR